MIEQFFPPMLAHQDNAKLGARGYLLQQKFDGTRAVIEKDGDKVQIIGRSFKNDYAPRYPEIVAEIRKLPVNRAILDSEFTFFIPGGRDTFLTVLATPAEVARRGLTYKLMIFDLLMLEGRDLRQQPIEARLSALGKVVEPDAHYKYLELVDTFTDPSQYKAIYEAIVKAGGEGVILKLCGSPYVCDSRDYMVKVKKESTTDCVVLGITEGTGARSAEGKFGALILGQYRNGKLVHVGASSGFDNRTMEILSSVIDKLPAHNYPWLQVRGVKKLVPPVLSIEVKFMQRTDAGMLRMPRFVRVRSDKKPTECVVEA